MAYKSNDLLKRKTKKASAKKAPPAKKLINGKYSHAQMVRFDPATGEALEALQKEFGDKTVNGAIIKIILKFAPMVKELKEAREQFANLRASSIAQVTLLHDLKGCFKKLQDIKLPEAGPIGRKCPDCGRPLDDDDYCDHCMNLHDQ